MVQAGFGFKVVDFGGRGGVKLLGSFWNFHFTKPFADVVKSVGLNAVSTKSVPLIFSYLHIFIFCERGGLEHCVYTYWTLVGCIILEHLFENDNKKRVKKPKKQSEFRRKEAPPK